MSSPTDLPQDALEERLKQRLSTMKIDDSLHLPAPSRNEPGFEAKLPNTLLSVTTVAFLLGCVFNWGISTCLTQPPRLWWATSQLGFFVVSWAAFHFGEFATTAGWNRDKCSIDSFLLQNGAMYHIANSIALAEYLFTLYLKPSFKTWPYVTAVGVVLVIAGQALRSAAMITAATNFNHSVQFKKADSHRLVTEGVYGWFRHPSYAGFFYWALGTQLVLQNPATFVVFVVLLWRFFYYRTRGEERALVKFFGKEYEEYRSRVGTMIPFIP